MHYACIMHAKSIQIRDVPIAVYDRLKEMAFREHRSLSQQALQALELGLVIGESQPERRSGLLSEWKKQPPAKWSKKLGEPYEAIREDRER